MYEKFSITNYVIDLLIVALEPTNLVMIYMS